MSQAPQNRELTERFIQFYRNYYREEIGDLAQQYPKEKRSLYIDYDDLYNFDPELADDYVTKPGQYQEYAEEALRLFDLPADVKLGQAHVRMRNLPDNIDIRNIRVNDDHIGTLISVQGIVRKATDVRPKITEAAFECQRCGTMSYIPQGDGGFQEPHECQGCERQGPFRIEFDQSNFVDSQKLRVQESPEGLRGGETPQSIDINLADDVTGKVTAGDHVTVVGILHIEQQTSGNEKTPVFDYYMEGIALSIEDEEFEDMEITDDDVAEIVELSNEPNIYEKMVDSVAPAIYGYEQEKLAMILQLFSGVTKHLPDGSRIRGDLHMLLIGDPGTGKCVTGNTRVTLADGRDVPIRELVESNLDDPKPIDDGVWDSANFEVPSLAPDGSLTARQATKVWKREAPDHLLRIRTNTGRELTATPSHPLFIRDGGMTTAVRADELAEGEFVAAPRSLPTTGTDDIDIDFRRSKSYNAVRLDLPDEWTPWLARLVGYIVAEGYVEQRDDATGFVSVTNNDREVLDDVADAFDRLGLNYFERSPHDGKSAREIICGSGEFVSFLANLSPSLLAGSDSQRIPEAVMSASSETGRAFVRAFVEGEGHVSATQREITVASMSRELLEDVRTLLLASGISSQLRARHNGSFRLRISGDDFAKYVAKVGFVTERKSAACEEYAAVESNTNTDVVPAGGELRDLREALGLTQTDCGLPRSTYQHYERGDRNPSRESLSRVVSSFEDAIRTTDGVDSHALADGGASVTDRVSELRSLVDGDIGWERIDSIERVESTEEWVYDLEVEGTHSYVSNGLVSHNSQMLSYIRHIAPRSVYTSGKGSSSAGLTAAAVRDDFGDGQQWTLEAGALVLADKGIAAVDELDKMRCVTGNSLVHLADGGIRRIRDLAHDAARASSIEELPNGRTIRNVDAEAWTMAEDGTLVTRPVTAIHEYDAPDELVQVTLESGEQLTSTPDHPFFVFEEGERVERPAEDLVAGDQVYVPDSDSHIASDGGIKTLQSEQSPDEPLTTSLASVESVERSDVSPDAETRVYDLTVEGTHNFVANGMVVHNSEDRSAMHEGLEQQQISVSKAGINATLKSRCSLLGAANPKYGRFDQYEPIGEQIDLEPALISRFDLIFTVTDDPDPDTDAELAEHIIKTNYAGELNTQRTNVANSEFTEEQVNSVTDEVAPDIDAELLRKYIAYSKRTCYPTLTEEAKNIIRDFYVDFRARGADEDAPVPVTARKLEALVRLSEASARVRLSDKVTAEDAERVTGIVESCLRDIGMDPETGEFDADIVETGRSKTQRDRIKNLLELIRNMQEEYEEGAPHEEVVERANAELNMDEKTVGDQLEKLKMKGDIYEPRGDVYRAT
ncbi:replicative DNA helicase / cell division control protein 21 /MCM [Haloferax elongans ATCC BAA-1513]|uniref:DNA helicase n=1 Tax=Haloferax elongans ATCC BAA-1513 TaxID=1230453 RepID=M0HS83_HALEO|nr:LAGLIDADG family homing endonuclease [Haloferax elongans]ELZ87356.1 replicative DNA helicase / cell division control protein 21 /MCM [Haloferax elongans ATCC BAA-1513]